MENVLSAGKVPYEEAPPLVPLTIGEILKLVLSVALDVCRVLVLSVPHFFESLFYLFISRPQKSIRNQTALVSGFH